MSSRRGKVSTERPAVLHSCWTALSVIAIRSVREYESSQPEKAQFRAVLSDESARWLPAPRLLPGHLPSKLGTLGENNRWHRSQQC